MAQNVKLKYDKEEKLPDFRLMLSGGVIGAGYNPGATMTIERGAAEKALEKLDVGVAVAIKLMNASKFSLIPAGAYATGGCLNETKQRSVNAGCGEIIVARKRKYRPTGSYGTMAWSIGGVDLFFVIGWSVPYSHLFHENWLMVGISDSPLSEECGIGPDWKMKRCFKKLYYAKDPIEGFGRKSFSDRQPYFPLSLRFTTHNYHLLAIMDSNLKSVATISIVPALEQDLARNCRRFVRGIFDETDEDSLEEFTDQSD